MQPTQQLTPAEYQRLLELVYSIRNPQGWQEIKAKLMILSDGAIPAPANAVTTGDRATYGGGSKPSNIMATPEEPISPQADVKPWEK